MIPDDATTEDFAKEQRVFEAASRVWKRATRQHVVNDCDSLHKFKHVLRAVRLFGETLVFITHDTSLLPAVWVDETTELTPEEWTSLLQRFYNK